MARTATSNGAVVVVGGSVVVVDADVVDVDVVDVDVVDVDVLVDAAVVLVSGIAVVVAAVVGGAADVGTAVGRGGVVDGRAACAINSSNWFSARSWALANSMPVPHN
jgi:hypothetical protein